MTDTLQGFSEASDDEFDAQLQALMGLPLEERLLGLAAAEAALRQRLGSSESASGRPD